MTPETDHMDFGQRHTPPVHTPRLRLKPKKHLSGSVDGAWWPHNADLEAELSSTRPTLSKSMGSMAKSLSYCWFPPSLSRPGTRHHDDRSRPGQCLDGRQSAQQQRGRKQRSRLASVLDSHQASMLEIKDSIK
jgi:hypothetical protein